MNAVLDELYRDMMNPAALGGVKALYREGKKRDNNLTLRDVSVFLQGVHTYMLNKPTLKRSPRRKILARKPSVILTCDLADFTKLHRHNGGIRYIMFCLDVFRRYFKVTTLTSKSGRSSLEALKKV